MSEEHNPESLDRRSPAEPLTRVVDMKMPLHWLLGVAGAVGWALVSMYFSVGQLVTQMTELQIAVKSGNNSVTAVAGELALQKFRLQSVEDSAKRNEVAIAAILSKR